MKQAGAVPRPRDPTGNHSRLSHAQSCISCMKRQGVEQAACLNPILRAGGDSRHRDGKPAHGPRPPKPFASPPKTCYRDLMTAALVPPELLDPVVAYFLPRRVILFGSVARGESGPDSDIDLLVVVDNDTPAEKVTIRAGRESRRPYRHPADVIPVREDTWHRFNGIVGTLPDAARTNGIVVYERE